jgi:hypothetical protein
MRRKPPELVEKLNCTELTELTNEQTTYFDYGQCSARFLETPTGFKSSVHLFLIYEQDWKSD